jgi:hypothetical protein
MGLVHADITLTNADDLGAVRRKLIEPEQVRRMTVSALADSGAIMMAINETVKSQLDLPTTRP